MNTHRLTCFKTVVLLMGAAFLFGALASGQGPVPGGTQDPTQIPKYVTPLVIPPAMPKTGTVMDHGMVVDYYEIAARQFQQQILPAGFPKTTVWGYGSVKNARTFNYPAFTIEAKTYRPVRVKWINDLKDPRTGHYLPPLLPVDQTIHWANPPAGPGYQDSHGMDPAPYTGPMPTVVHVHGAHVQPDSDGYPEAWYLPNANNIPAGYATQGTHYGQYVSSTPQPGAAIFQYPNDQPGATLWYHDHALGLTRLNVWAGLAGFYLLRDRIGDLLEQLPGPAPATYGEPPRKAYEIPILIQDRSFNADGSLFYPDNRAFFEGLTPDQLQIPFMPDPAVGGMSDVSPIWNPEVFGNVMVVNGVTWPYLNVEARRYRIRFLNGCNARTLFLQFDRPQNFWQIGAEGGFLPAPVELAQLRIAPAERADVIIDFTHVPPGTVLTLLNLGPDYPYQGGIPNIDFPASDPGTTGQVMQFRVVRRTSADRSTPPSHLHLPPLPVLEDATATRQVSINELDSSTVFYTVDADGNLVFDPLNPDPFGPVNSMLGTVNSDGTPNPMRWGDPITENPELNSTEIWELRNYTEDVHPLHLHLVQFQVLEREDAFGNITPPEPWEMGYKDTVMVFPGGITRIKAKFDIEGLYVYHCHMLEHEDNELMRPYYVGVLPAGMKAPTPAPDQPVQQLK